MSERSDKPLAIFMSRRFRSAMADNGLNSADLIRKTTIGHGQMSNYMNGHFMMRVDKLKELCEALGCSSDYILGLSDFMYNPTCPGSCMFVKTRKEKNEE